MDPQLAAMGIGAIGNVIGGLFNSNAAANAQGTSERIASENMRNQQIFAQNGISWRASDVMNAYNNTGIHPLALLGVQGPSYSPVNYVGSADTSIGDAISKTGQGVSRAMLEGASDKARLATVARLDDLARERGGLENELLKVRIASEKARLFQGLSPSPGIETRVIPGQGNVPPIDTTSIIRDTNPVRDAVNPDVSHARVPGGSFFPMPSKSTKELIEDNGFQQFMHAFRNNWMPWIDSSYRTPPPDQPLGKDEEWGYNPVQGYYRRPIRVRTRTAYEGPIKY